MIKVILFSTDKLLTVLPTNIIKQLELDLEANNVNFGVVKDFLKKLLKKLKKNLEIG